MRPGELQDWVVDRCSIFGDRIQLGFQEPKQWLWQVQGPMQQQDEGTLLMHLTCASLPKVYFRAMVSQRMPGKVCKLGLTNNLGYLSSGQVGLSV